MPRYENHTYEGYTFVFKYDDDNPDLLHIWARHRKTIEDAIEVWFEGTREDWNSEQRRFETFDDRRGLYWFWIEKDKVIMVISCFDN